MGALIGAAASYLFFTERGRGVRDKLEPAIDDLQREFTRFRGTIEHLSHLANDGMRMVEEFKTARQNEPFPSQRTSH